MACRETSIGAGRQVRKGKIQETDDGSDESGGRDEEK